MKEQQAINSKGEAIPGGTMIIDTPKSNNDVSIRQLEILRNSLPSSKKEFVQKAINHTPQKKKHIIIDFIDNLLDGYTPENP